VLSQGNRKLASICVSCPFAIDVWRRVLVWGISPYLCMYKLPITSALKIGRKLQYRQYQKIKTTLQQIMHLHIVEFVERKESADFPK